MKSKLVLLLVLGLMTAPVFGKPVPVGPGPLQERFAILRPGDPIIAIDADGLASTSRYPGGENPLNVVDGTNNKYLNFGGINPTPNNTGFIVKANGSVVASFALQTGNDSPERDPSSYELWGTNKTIKSKDNSTGLGEKWYLIGGGSIVLPDPRNTWSAILPVSNTTSYSSYKMVFPTVKGATNLMQIDEAQFYDEDDNPILAPGMSVLAISENEAWNSRYPANEKTPNVIDQDPVTKYLNFGEENSGFIATPSIGPSTLDAFEITTANDAVERDPTRWLLYGTNAPITSADNSAGDSEIWKLIAGGSVDLPLARNTLGPLVPIIGQTETYTSYKMIFPNVRDASAANSMQINEIQFYGIPEPATVALLGLGGLSLLRIRRKR